MIWPPEMTAGAMHMPCAQGQQTRESSKNRPQQDGRIPPSSSELRHSHTALPAPVAAPPRPLPLLAVRTCTQLHQALNVLKMLDTFCICTATCRPMAGASCKEQAWPAARSSRVQQDDSAVLLEG